MNKRVHIATDVCGGLTTTEVGCGVDAFLLAALSVLLCGLLLHEEDGEHNGNEEDHADQDDDHEGPVTVAIAAVIATGAVTVGGRRGGAAVLFVRDLFLAVYLIRSILPFGAADGCGRSTTRLISSAGGSGLHAFALAYGGGYGTRL